MMQHKASQTSDQIAKENWFLVQLKPGGFTRAVTNLQRQGFETFMPLRPETRRKGEKLVTENRPLFPGYLFVSVDPDRRDWRKINNTFGVARLVCLDGLQPSRVPTPLIQGLMHASRDDVWTAEPVNLPVGTTVSLVTGLFAGAVAQILSSPENGRVFVLMELMGQAVRTAVPLRALERVGAARR